MPQAGTKNFAGLTALRIMSGAAEAIADPAFMLFTSMFYTRAEQPSRISTWYACNGLGVAGGGLIGKYASGASEFSSSSLDMCSPLRLMEVFTGVPCATWEIST